MYRKIFSILIFSVLLAPSLLHSQDTQDLPSKTRILFLLDGSGSMLASWESTNRISIAKELLASLVDSLRVNQDLQLALRVYGHRYSRQAQNCRDSHLEIPFSPGNHAQIIQRLTTIEPKGTTPIAYSLEQAANDFPDATGYRNIIIMITDGIESCDGDPCQVSLALQRNGVFLRPFIIGVGLDTEIGKAFECIGTYYDAHDVGGFREALSVAIETSLSQATVSVDIRDEQNASSQTDINVSFINAVTGEADFNFIHYRDTNGRPDSVTLDPVVPYHVQVNTFPPVTLRNQLFPPGRHTLVKIEAPRGALRITQDGAGVYGPGLRAIVTREDRPSWYNAQGLNIPQEYLTGNYEVEVLTVPRVKITNVRISTGEETLLDIPSPGIVNLDHSAGGYGSIYVLSETGRQTWVQDLNHQGSRISVALQPGAYRIVFRAKNAPGSKYTSVKEFTVNEGQSSVIKLF